MQLQRGRRHLCAFGVAVPYGGFSLRAYSGPCAGRAATELDIRVLLRAIVANITARASAYAAALAP